MAKTILVFDFGASSARAMLCKYEDGALIEKLVHYRDSRTDGIPEADPAGNINNTKL